MIIFTSPFSSDSPFCLKAILLSLLSLLILLLFITSFQVLIYWNLVECGKMPNVLFHGIKPRNRKSSNYIYSWIQSSVENQKGTDSYSITQTLTPCLLLKYEIQISLFYFTLPYFTLLGNVFVIVNRIMCEQSFKKTYFGCISRHGQRVYNMSHVSVMHVYSWSWSVSFRMNGLMKLYFIIMD